MNDTVASVRFFKSTFFDIKKQLKTLYEWYCTIVSPTGLARQQLAFIANGPSAEQRFSMSNNYLR